MNEPHEPVHFTDRDLGHQFPALLRAAGVRVERHDDHFGPQTSDSEWITEIGRRKWIALTRDQRIRYSPLAQASLMSSGAKLFVLTGKLTTREAAEIFLKYRDDIENLARTEKQPFIAKIRRDGVHMWLRHNDWVKSDISSR